MLFWYDTPSKKVLFIYISQSAERIRCPCDRTLSSKQIGACNNSSRPSRSFSFFFKDKKFLKIKIDFLKMNFDKNCSLSTQVYVNYISCPNNFKICCHPNPSYNSLIISTLVLKNYEDLIPHTGFKLALYKSSLFIHTIICIYTWDSTG